MLSCLLSTMRLTVQWGHDILTIVWTCDKQVATLHPRHTAASVRSLLERFHYFKQGNCIVHHMFGDDVRTFC